MRYIKLQTNLQDYLSRKVLITGGKPDVGERTFTTRCLLKTVRPKVEWKFRVDC